MEMTIPQVEVQDSSTQYLLISLLPPSEPCLDDFECISKDLNAGKENSP